MRLPYPGDSARQGRFYANTVRVASRFRAAKLA